ncbi:MAG TPA: mechanosensitive ion channel family protein [Kiritimatiellia bacterium]|nr:mechanosensitive ion channel family protein [Kiritimatiellia bacterium]
MDTNPLTWHQTLIAGNEVWRLVLLFIVLLASLIGGKMFKLFLFRTSDRLEGVRRLLSAASLRAVTKVTMYIALVIGLRIGATFLAMPENLNGIVNTTLAVMIAVGVGLLLYHLTDVIDVWLANRAKASASKMDQMLAPIVRTSLRVTIIVLTILQIAQLLTDKPLTSIIAGLGVGGLAIALAAQDTIKHFFGSIVIFSDKPFQIGERITVDGIDGTIEEVGFRSSRIRTLDGHLVTMANGDLANKTITNIARRPYIRRVLNLSLTYDTPPEKILRAKEILAELLDNHEGFNPEFPPRIVFNDFGPAHLNLLVIYWYFPPVFWDYMAFSEKLNLQILERFNQEGIEFAFPTQTLYLAGDPKRPLNPSPSSSPS